MSLNERNNNDSVKFRVIKNNKHIKNKSKTDKEKVKQTRKKKTN